MSGHIASQEEYDDHPDTRIDRACSELRSENAALRSELARVKEAVRHHPLAADGSVITLGSRWTTRSLYADSLPGEMIEVVVTSVGHTTVRAATNGRELDLPYLPENLHPLTTALVDRARKEKQ